MFTHRFEYIVRPGDTLFKIATDFGVPLETLIKLNKPEDPDKINVGDKITVPVSEEFYTIWELVKSQCEGMPDAVEVSAQEKPETHFWRYRVRRGDTLSSIARQNNTTVANILALNPEIKDKNMIFAGSVITLPAPYDDAAFVFTVRPGDTLFSIARETGTTVDKILEYNYLTSPDMIYPGQQLVIVA